MQSQQGQHGGVGDSETIFKFNIGHEEIREMVAILNKEPFNENYNMVSVHPSLFVWRSNIHILEVSAPSKLQSFGLLGIWQICLFLPFGDFLTLGLLRRTQQDRTTRTDQQDIWEDRQRAGHQPEGGTSDQDSAKIHRVPENSELPW